MRNLSWAVERSQLLTFLWIPRRAGRCDLPSPPERSDSPRGRRDCANRSTYNHAASKTFPAARRQNPWDLVFSNRVRRGIQIAISVVALFLLLKPFDCFTGSKFTKEAADCCKRGKCRPSTSDDCCKGTLPGGKDLVTASKAQQNHAAVALPVIGAVVLWEPLFTPTSFHEPSAPPESPPNFRLNLPLRI